jgi:mono/diheme cytochrome c family protein
MQEIRGLLLRIFLCATAVAALAGIGQTDAEAQSDWTIPAGAAQEQNPVTVSPDVLEKGRKIFQNNCQRCHGRDGRGRGPDADPEHPAGNFTDPLRLAFNPDGVMFYKIWNGRESPKMPAFRKEDLSRNDVWTVIHFVKTFRATGR